MKSNLETFVKENREAFDTLEPTANLWNSIDLKIQNPSIATSKISWLKSFIFGASIITGIVIVTTNSISKKTEKHRIKKIVDSTLINSQTQEEKNTPEISSNKVSLINPVSSLKIVPAFMFIPEIKTDNLQTIFSNVYPNLEYPIEVKKSFTTPLLKQNEICECGNITGTFILNDTVFNGIKEIEICSNNADITILGNEDDKTFLDFEYITPEEKKKKKIVKIEQNKIFYEISDTKLTISIKSGEKTYFNKGFNSIKQVKLDLRVPPSTLLSIKNSNGNVSIKNIANSQSFIDNSNGDIKIADLNSDLKIISNLGNLNALNSQGKLNIEGGLGDVDVFDFTGNINLKLNSGNAKISTLKGNLEIKSNLGEQELRNISGTIHSETSSGDTKLFDCFGNIEIESSLGDQTLQNISGNVKSQSNSGDIKILNLTGNLDITSDLGDTDIDRSKGNLSLNTRSGSITGKNIELVESVSINSNLGDVNLNTINKMEDLSFDLKTDLGDININKDNQQYSESTKLVINKGKIMVKIISNSGDIELK